jgi:hypothetical protein
MMPKKGGVKYMTNDEKTRFTLRVPDRLLAKLKKESEEW